VRHRLDALPGGDDLAGPGPGGGDLEGPAAPAADEAGGGVQEAVAQCLRLGSALARSPSRAMSFSQASRMQAVIAASNQEAFSP
jgi:hypothetical protein